jgi:diadenosine tetraphosphate (Ap4A) HIT family hydrolase
MANEAIPPECPFCRGNGLLKGVVIAESVGSYLTENAFFPGNYLIIPSEHVESPVNLPDNWWQGVKELLGKIPAELGDYNMAFNVGKQAGQTIKHLHFWVVPRQENQPATGKGLITLINFRNEHE